MPCLFFWRTCCAAETFYGGFLAEVKFAEADVRGAKKASGAADPKIFRRRWRSKNDPIWLIWPWNDWDSDPKSKITSIMMINHRILGVSHFSSWGAEDLQHHLGSSMQTHQEPSLSHIWIWTICFWMMWMLVGWFWAFLNDLSESFHADLCRSIPIKQHRITRCLSIATSAMFFWGQVQRRKDERRRRHPATISMWRQIFSWNSHRSIMGKTNTIVNQPLGNEISKRRKKSGDLGDF